MLAVYLHALVPVKKHEGDGLVREIADFDSEWSTDGSVATSSLEPHDGPQWIRLGADSSLCTPIVHSNGVNSNLN